MNEDFLHYLWKYRLFRQEGLMSSLGEPIHIIKPGEHNTHSGPDFFNARIQIGKTIWAGNVEIHLRASDWKRHAHQKDPSYNNIILHVVRDSDEPVFRRDGKLIPVLSLAGKYDTSLWDTYSSLMASRAWIPCAGQVKEVDTMTLNAWLDRIVISRLESKSTEIIRSLDANRNNWELSFYHFLARNFGFKTNAGPFEMLARSLPLSCLSKNKNDLPKIEALLFGQSGMLEQDFKDEYPTHLKKEYAYLRKKFSLVPNDKHLWKFLRMRPVNFPTIRIAQFAGLVLRSSHLFSKIMECEDISSLKNLFDTTTSSYWESHFVFDAPSVHSGKQLGTLAINNLLINTVVPFLFVRGIKKKEDELKEKALFLLRQIPSEKNSIISGWEKIGLKVPDAYTSQALLHLKNDFCSPKKCLTCAIGWKLLKRQ